jgi:hypothetical protein
MKDLRKKVLHCLEKHQLTRDDDLLLTQTIWMEFHMNKLKYSDEYGDYFVSMKSLRELPREDHVSRVRRKIQNEELMYLPTRRDVAKKRGIAEDKWREYVGALPKNFTD